MSTLLSVILDSGIFLTDLESANLPYLDVGYFHSTDSGYDAQISADGSLLGPRLSFPSFPSSLVSFDHLDVVGRVQGRMHIMNDLKKSLLSYEDLYGSKVGVNETRFDFLLRFSSGVFTPSMVKARVFKEESHPFYRRMLPEVAHNVAIYYYLELGESFEIKQNGSIIWSSKSLSPGTTHVSIEVIADNSTTSGFYKDVLKLPPGQPAWLPNEGDPPCCRVHGSGKGIRA